MGEKKGSEKRKHPRLANNIPIRLTLVNSSDTVTETANISRSGAYCKVNAYIEPMTKLKLNLLLPIRKNGKNATKKIVCEGVVVRAEQVSDDASDDSYNIAIFFSDITKRDSESIADYVNSFLEQEAN